MIFLEHDLQRSALHGRVEFKVTGQGGLVAAAARTQASPPTSLVSRFTFYVQLFTTTLLFPNVANTHAHAHTRTRAHAQAHAQAHAHKHTSLAFLRAEPEPVRRAHCFCHPLQSRDPLPASSCALGASRPVAVIGPGRRSSHKSDRWACSPHVHTAPRRRPPPFLGTRWSCAGLPFQIAPLSCSASPVSLAGGTASQLPACLAPIPISHPCPIIPCPSSLPVRSGGSLSVPSGCTGAVSPPRSGHHLLRVPALVPVPPNPRSTQQPLKSLAAQCPRLITNQTHPWSIRRCIPLCYLCRGLEVSYPLLSHPRPCRSSGRCVMEEA